MSTIQELDEEDELNKSSSSVGTLRSSHTLPPINQLTPIKTASFNNSDGNSRHTLPPITKQ